MAKITNIDWETDGEKVDLPTEVELPNDIDPKDEDAVNDYLSDTYGWLTIEWCVSYKYEIYDHNDEVMESTDDLEFAQIYADNHEAVAKFVMNTETNEIVWGSIRNQ